MLPASSAGNASMSHNATGAASDVPRLKMIGWLTWYWY
jgi:hypothetical protein